MSLAWAIVIALCAGLLGGLAVIGWFLWSLWRWWNQGVQGAAE